MNKKPNNTEKRGHAIVDLLPASTIIELHLFKSKLNDDVKYSQQHEKRFKEKPLSSAH